MNGTTNIANLRYSKYWKWSPDKQITNIADVTVADNGELIVIDGGDCRVVRFDARGYYKGQFGHVGYGPGQMRNPGGLFLGSDGTLYVADTGNSRIYKIPLDSIR